MLVQQQPRIAVSKPHGRVHRPGNPRHARCVEQNAESRNRHRRCRVLPDHGSQHFRLNSRVCLAEHSAGKRRHRTDIVRLHLTSNARADRVARDSPNYHFGDCPASCLDFRGRPRCDRPVPGQIVFRPLQFRREAVAAGRRDGHNGGNCQCPERDPAGHMPSGRLGGLLVIRLGDCHLRQQDLRVEPTTPASFERHSIPKTVGAMRTGRKRLADMSGEWWGHSTAAVPVKQSLPGGRSWT